jgi:DNA-binding beta-propeller fold protein YncE
MHYLGVRPASYVLEPEWARLPPGLRLGDVAGVAVDQDDRVYIFNRGAHPMVVLDREGKFLRSWGEGIFTRPHGVDIGRDGYVYCTDDGDHTVRQFTPEGTSILEMGVPGRGAESMSGRPFNRCTHTALSPDGDIYVSDGYGNAHVHKFSADGRHLRTWGGPGSGPGQFNLPHNICCDAEGWVYVADRENNRIQIFDGEGRFETQWRGLQRPCAMCIQLRSPGQVYIGGLAPFRAAEELGPGQGPRITILTRQGDIAQQIGGERPGIAPTQYIAPHGIAVDSGGNIFLGEVAHAAWVHYFPNAPCPPDITTFRKLAKADCWEAHDN